MKRHKPAAIFVLMICLGILLFFSGVASQGINSVLFLPLAGIGVSIFVFGFFFFFFLYYLLFCFLERKRL
jgi:hypothetical protein